MGQNHFVITLISHFTSLTCFFIFMIFCNIPAILVSSALADPEYLACAPKTCGNGPNISYPFYIQNQQSPFCGYPGFELSCNNKGNPFLKLPGQNNQYIIHQIFYHNQSLRLSNAAVTETNAGSACITISQMRNQSLPSDRFELVPNQTELFLLSNCNSSSLPDNLLDNKAETCWTGDQELNRAVLALVKEDPDLDLAKKYCKDLVVAPVDGYGQELETGEMVMMRRGFLMKWIASDGSVCEESGGKCGFDHSTYHFKCFCPDRPHALACTRRAQDHQTIKVAAATTIPGIGVLTIIVAFCFRKKFSSNNWIAFWRKKTKDYQNIEIFLKNYGSLAPKRYSYFDIKKMTNSFKDKLGQGGYGGVYKGRLHDGRNVAVKLLDESKGNGEEFINKVASISKTSHVNIVSLFGYCFEGNKRALIYEFVSNGSLEKFIQENNPNYKQLKWEKLYQIAVGIARGLEYLYSGCNTRILHFDIKPHNILLDEDFYPKISDFGLAKICPKNESIISMTDAQGTIGYIAPEVFYRQFDEVSHKSDVYSYGMTVLEMTGGRKNLDIEDGQTSELYFPHWIYECLEVDEELGLEGIGNEEDNEYARR